MTTLTELVADRLLALDANRARLEKPKLFSYMGPRTPGGIAINSAAMIAEFREGDPVPEGAKFCGSWHEVQIWYRMRVKTTPTGQAERWLTEEEYYAKHGQSARKY